jgi:hypothetical protein
LFMLNTLNQSPLENSQFVPLTMVVHVIHVYEVPKTTACSISTVGIRWGGVGVSGKCILNIFLVIKKQQQTSLGFVLLRTDRSCLAQTSLAGIGFCMPRAKMDASLGSQPNRPRYDVQCF